MSYHDSPIVPSIIANDQQEFAERLMRTSFAHSVHIDVMDGLFVPNTSFDRHGDFTFKHLAHFHTVEVHLMAVDPTHWIDYLVDVADLFIIPVEIPRAQEMISYIKSLNKRAGLAINPQTQIGNFIPLLEQVNHITVMTVEPGDYGAPFIESALEKVSFLRGVYPTYDIECDGAMNENTIARAKMAGANRFVAGSILQKAAQPQRKYQLLNELIKDE